MSTEQYTQYKLHEIHIKKLLVFLMSLPNMYKYTPKKHMI